MTKLTESIQNFRFGVEVGDHKRYVTFEVFPFMWRLKTTKYGDKELPSGFLMATYWVGPFKFDVLLYWR